MWKIAGWSGMLALGVAALVLAPATAAAQTDAPETYAGDLWSRPRLTGDWWGSRDWLAKRGVTFDFDLLQILQGVGTGGRDTGVAYDGLVNYELNLDTGKLGLWPGGFLKVKAFSTFGDTVDNDSGATLPVNIVGGTAPPARQHDRDGPHEPDVRAVPQQMVRRVCREGVHAHRRRQRLRPQLLHPVSQHGLPATPPSASSPSAPGGAASSSSLGRGHLQRVGARPERDGDGQ